LEGDIIRVGHFDYNSSELRMNFVRLGKDGWGDEEQLRWTRQSQVPTLDLSFPDIGYMNYKGGALYVSRRVQRQWHMGFHQNSAQIIDGWVHERSALSSGLRDEGDLVHHHEFVRRLFNRNYVDFAVAMRLLRNNSRFACALNRYVAVGKSCQTRNAIIRYKNRIVGYVNRENSRPYLFAPAEYVQRVLPFEATIVENADAFTI
jgi:hypothetical protein